MKSVLTPEALAILRTAKPAPPLFSNAVLAELWDGKYRRGPIRMLRRTDGRFVILDERLPMGRQTLSDWATEGLGALEIDRLTSIAPTPKEDPK